MVQIQQQGRIGARDASWLAMLIDSFEATGRAPVSDPRVLAALMAQLVQPVSPRGRCDRNVRFLH
jgi:hypothetical protein